MGRIAAIDYGAKRIGIAVSDENRKISFPQGVVAGGPKAFADIKKMFGEKKIDLILLGLPLLMNGQEGEMAIIVKKFGIDLEKALEIPVQLIDERFTSKIAERSLREICLNRKERSAKIDETTAAMLLQSYLDSHDAR